MHTHTEKVCHVEARVEGAEKVCHVEAHKNSKEYALKQYREDAVVGEGAEKIRSCRCKAVLIRVNKVWVQ